MSLELHLFGSPRIYQGGDNVPLRRRKGLALLSYLAITQKPQSRETLLGLLWPEFPTDKARNNLRRELSLLRKHFHQSLFLADTNQVRLDPAAELWVDVLAFQAAAEGVLTPAVNAITTVQEAEQLGMAVGSFSDEFMAGFSLPDCLAFEDWQRWQATQLRQTLSSALAALVTWHEEQSAYEAAIQYAQRWLALDSLNEPVHRHLIRLFALAGQRAASMRQYEACVRIFDEELGVPPEQETSGLFEAVQKRKFPKPPIANIESDLQISSHPTPASKTHQPKYKLPIPPTPFIGRTEEVAEIVRRIKQPACRLLTLVGPGGIGKTRLSLAVAEQLGRPTQSVSSEDAVSAQIGFADGLFFVPLQPVTTAQNIPSAIAETVRFRFQGPASAWQQLRNYLQQQEMLLVLDNFEHLLDGANFVADVLAHCRQIKMLVTSREALNLREEWFHPIAGLRYTSAADADANGAELVDAAKLFAHHAARVQADFSLDAHAADVKQICQMVEGVPLAIELAAGWLRALSVSDIVEELERGLDILTGYERDLPERHRSMQSVLEHSWSLLGHSQQASLEALSAFRGGFTRDAAQEVAGASYPDLIALVNKSWLQLKEERYQIHELLRQFLSRKLETDTLAEKAALERHRNYYLGFLASRLMMLNGPEQQQALLEIEGDLDNIRIAWTHGVQELALDSLALAVEPFYEMHTISGRYEEASRAFHETIAALEQAKDSANLTLRDQALGMLLVRQADISIHLGNHSEASSYLERSQSSSLSAKDKAWFYRLQSDVALARGDRAATEAYLQEGLALARELGDEIALINFFDGLSVLATSFGEFESGQRLAQECLDVARTLGRPDFIARSLGVLAWATNCLGYYELSEAYWRESLAICYSIDDKRGIARALNFLGWETWSQGGDRLAASRAYHEESIALLRKLGSRAHLVMALADFGLVTNELGDFETTVQCCVDGMALAKEANMPSYIAYNQTSLGVAHAALGQVEQGFEHVRQAIKIHFETEQTPQCLLSLYYLILLCTQHPSQLGRLGLSKDLFYSIVNFVAQHPFNYRPIGDRARLLQAELTASIPPDSMVPESELPLDLIVMSVLGDTS